mmetsp:Transcript_92473/g.169678  ORF Transcript_92473/g.169678 Transcript_92473/m.169678 type:complete len:202 (-) Transcript_92473:89-694(-)
MKDAVDTRASISIVSVQDRSAPVKPRVQPSTQNCKGHRPGLGSFGSWNSLRGNGHHMLGLLLWRLPQVKEGEWRSHRKTPMRRRLSHPCRSFFAGNPLIHLLLTTGWLGLLLPNHRMRGCASSPHLKDLQRFLIITCAILLRGAAVICSLSSVYLMHLRSGCLRNLQTCCPLCKLHMKMVAHPWHGSSQSSVFTLAVIWIR